MEAKQKRKNDEPRPQRRIILWSVLFSLIMLINHYVFLVRLYGPGDVYYNFNANLPFALYFVAYTFITVIGTPVIAIVAFIWGLIRRKGAYLIASIIVISSWGWLLIGIDTRFPDRIDYGSIDNRTYVLATTNNVGDVEFSPADLYQCEENHFVCHLVERGGSAESYEWFYDSEKQIIVVFTVIEDEPHIIFQYQVE